MITYSSPLKVIDGKVYHITGFNSTFCLCHDKSGDIEFSGFDPNSKEVFLQKRGGEKMVICGIDENLFRELKGNRCIEPFIEELTGGKYEIKAVNWELEEVDIRDVVRKFTTMQDYININQHMWAIEDPTVFKGQPGYENFFQLLFAPWEDPYLTVPTLAK